MSERGDPADERPSGRLAALRGYVVPVLAVTILVTVIGGVRAAGRAKVYEARAKIALGPAVTEHDPIAMPGADADRFMATQVAVLSGHDVYEIVKAKIGAGASATAAPVPGSHVLEVRGRDRNPRRAAEIVNAYADAYVQARHAEAVQVLTAQADELKRSINENDQRIVAVAQQLGAAPAERIGPEQSLRSALLDDRELTNRRIGELEAQAATQTGPPQVLTSATAPTAPVNSTSKSVTQALLLGLALGAAIAFSLDYLKGSARRST